MSTKYTFNRETTGDYAVCDKQSLISLQEDYNNSKLLIKKLKSDKKKLKDALKTVINERNHKNDKLNRLRQKYLQLENYLNNKIKFIDELQEEYAQLKKENLQKKESKKKYKKDIDILLQNARISTKSHKVFIKYNESDDNKLTQFLKMENWEAACQFMLEIVCKPIKHSPEYKEVDTPEFVNTNFEDKIDRFLSSSKVLLESLLKQQNNLAKFGKDYQVTNIATQRHSKTTSNLFDNLKIKTCKNSCITRKPSIEKLNSPISHNKHKSLADSISDNISSKKSFKFNENNY
jgi:hypothetical protein